MIRWALVVLAVGIFGVPADAVAQATRERLDNGLTVLVRENPVAPVVAVSLLVSMGTRWEEPSNAGISNFVHAVMVRGTAKRSGAELAEAIAALGAHLSDHVQDRRLGSFEIGRLEPRRHGDEPALLERAVAGLDVRHESQLLADGLIQTRAR